MKSASRIEELVTQLAKPIVTSEGMELVDVEYVREAGEWFLRIYLDKEGGVSIDDCTLVSERLGRELDAIDPIPQSYILEVSSSGEKPLRKEEDFTRFAGRRVLINTYTVVDGRKSLEGYLEGLENNEVKVNVDGKVLRVPREKISKARLVVEV
ncbi:MAG TPA: ribosome maturation factor RimP [Firmicutes bacterium]|nr:ribosome maturation factor RimP [Bacillota bacterium]